MRISHERLAYINGLFNLNLEFDVFVYLFGIAIRSVDDGLFISIYLQFTTIFIFYFLFLK